MLRGVSPAAVLQHGDCIFPTSAQ